MRTYTYSEARQNLAALLDEANRSGEVRIRPLDVDGIETDLSGDEIATIVREMRRRPR